MNKKSNKVNPRRKPATQEDVRRAEEKGRNDAIRMILYLVLYILVDKHGVTADELGVYQDEINFMLQSIISGDVVWADIQDVLDSEYDVHLELK